MSKLLSAALLALPLCGQADPVPVAEARVNGAPAVPVVQGEAEPAWQPRETELRRLQRHKQMQPGYRPHASEAAAPPKQAAYRGGKTDNDAWRCDVARDIKSDKQSLSIGMPIDATDLQTAENDIRRFCR